MVRSASNRESSLRHGVLSCFNCHSRCRTPFRDMGAAELELFNFRKTAHEYRAHQTILYEGNPCLGVYCVESGTIAIKRTDGNGDQRTTRLCQQGETIGYRSFVMKGPYLETAEAISNSRVCFVPNDMLEKLIERSATLANRLLEQLAEEAEELEHQLLSHRSLSVRARLAQLLFELKDRFGDVDDEGAIHIELPISRSDISELIGARPESLSRAIRELEHPVVVRFDGRHVVIPDLDAVMDEFEGAPWSPSI